MPATPLAAPAVMDAFIEKWRHAQGAERSNKDSFLNELCDLLGVARPDPKVNDPAQDLYVFERDLPFANESGKVTSKFADLYKDGCFVLEAKQGTNESGRGGIGKRETHPWLAEMQKAAGQARSYAGSLDQPPPFIVVCDIGFCLDLYAAFDGSGDYRPFPRPLENRHYLKDLPRHSDTLRALFLDPLSLDPSRRAIKVTREVAAHLATLANDLEEAGHHPEHVAKFLMRCIFTMFAEDVALLKKDLFKDKLEKEWLKHPDRFAPEVRALWDAMDKGERIDLGTRLLRFNGGLFKGSFALPLTKAQLGQLLECAKSDWSQVEPSIFGTLLERALSSTERHKLGAHYTPRAYVERLVRPTLEEPLRAEWDAVRLIALKALESDKPAPIAKARKQVVEFHTRLCHTRVLDPACGTGNFLYVAFDLFKRLEGEVLALERQLTGEGQTLGIEGLQISPKQFLGIEVKRWAKEIADLVLWIGYLQWHFRTRGNARPEEPVLREYNNIECRDAVLAFDEKVQALGDDGKPLTRWDGETMKKSPVTGKDVPDDTARVPVWKYTNPRKAKWPEAEFVVGNPPFLGNKRMRDALGDGYSEALREAHGDMPGSVDFVMYWWDLAARRLLSKNSKLQRFGFITTNSITQTFNRKVLAAHMDAKKPLHLAFAVPDHPWVDSADGAAVRIAMSVGAPGAVTGRLGHVVAEHPGPDGEQIVDVGFVTSPIGSNLSAGGLDGVQPLASNANLSFMGVSLIGQGFVIDADDPLMKHRGGNLRPYVIGRDLNQAPASHYVVDFFGLAADVARRANGDLFQRLVDRVRPEREINNREGYRTKWWLYGEQREGLRNASRNLHRYVVTCRTAKHRVFSFVEGATVVESTVIAIASNDAFTLGVLSSRLHTVYALAAGGTLEDRPRYNNSLIFSPFPFPAATDAQKARIRALGEELDAHRKQQQAAHDDLTITGMYNVLEKLRSGETLTDKERVIHSHGLVSVLKDLHDRLDAAVFDAYGWPAALTDEQIIERLVALNAERAAEEKKGLVRWLRPEFQQPSGTPSVQQTLAPDDDETPELAAVAAKAAWPKALPERMTLVRDAVATARTVAAAPLAKALGARKVAEVEEVLDGLAVLGYLRASGEGAARRWSVAGRKVT